MSALSPFPSSRSGFAASPLEVVHPIIDWIDREIHHSYTAEQGRGGNRLLEARQIFAHRSPSQIVAKFLKLLPRLEKHHFLLSYRIRQWIALHFEIHVSDPLARTVPITYPLLQNDFASLKRAKYHYFEHSSIAISLDDIRVKILPRARILT